MSDSEPRKKEETPLRVKIERGCITIKIGIETLAWAANHLDDWNPWDDKKNDYVQKWVVIDHAEFAKDVVHEMLNEREDGSHPLSDFLDKMINEAADQGSIGVDECKTGKSAWDTDRALKPGRKSK